MPESRPTEARTTTTTATVATTTATTLARAARSLVARLRRPDGPDPAPAGGEDVLATDASASLVACPRCRRDVHVYAVRCRHCHTPSSVPDSFRSSRR